MIDADREAIARAEKQIYASYEQRLRESKPQFEALIKEVTGWSGVEDLAEIMVRTLVANVGGGSGMPWRTRCGCGSRPLEAESEAT
jgi:hypothetical protein